MNNSRHQSAASSLGKTSADLWWDTYLDFLVRHGVREKIVPWYRRRVEQLLQRHPGVRSVALLGADIEAYFVGLDGLGLPGWQLAQTLDAIQRFGIYIKADWVQGVSWTDWQHRWVGKADAAERAIIEQGILPDEDGLRAFAVFLRVQHLSLKTEKSYLQWVERCRRFHGLGSTRELRSEHVAPFLESLAAEHQVSASTQKQALCALVAFLKGVQGLAEVHVDAFRPGMKPRQVPTVLSRNEVRLVLVQLREDPMMHLGASLLYGAGLRLMEAIRLRIKDLDFDHRVILILDAKGGASRRAPMPESIVAALMVQVQRTQELHAVDVTAGYGFASLPSGLARKFQSAAKDLSWQYLFPSSRLALDPRDRQMKRHHLDESVLQTSGAGTKEIANSLLAEAQRARRRGGTAKHPFSHGDTERKDQVKIPNSQLLAGEQPKPNPGFLSFLRALRASVRAWLLEISFCHKKKLKISATKGGETGGHWGKTDKAGKLSYPAPFLCHASFGTGVRYSNGARSAWTQGCTDDHDLYACPEPTRFGNSFTGGCIVERK